MMDNYFVSGATVKENLKDSFRLIETISDQIRSDTEIPRNSSEDLYDKIQAVVSQLIYIYGYQELYL